MKGLKVISPLNRKFQRLTDYRYYRLRRTSEIDPRDVVDKARRNTNYMSHKMPYVFSGKDPICVLMFLSAFVSKADGLRFTEGEAYIVLPNFLRGRALDHLTACQNSEDATYGVYNWPSAVNCLLRMFATNRNIAAAVSDFQAIRQKPGQDEDDYQLAFEKAHVRAGSFLRQADLITNFVEGLDSRVVPRVRRYRDSHPKASIY